MEKEKKEELLKYAIIIAVFSMLWFMMYKMWKEILGK